MQDLSRNDSVEEKKETRKLEFLQGHPGTIIYAKIRDSDNKRKKVEVQRV